MGIAPLPASVAASDKIAANLAILAREPCDGKAIAALGEALVKQRAERSAAEARLEFAKACAKGDGTRFAPRQILNEFGDNAKVVTILDALIAKSPGVVVPTICAARRWPAPGAIATRWPITRAR